MSTTPEPGAEPQMPADIHSETFAAECRRQSLLLRDDPHEKEIMDFLESIADTDGWE
ncbi:MAG: Antitoxin MazE [Gammaproteobacteria bacterium]|nr:Antitoxin MazE [Gammaproteobacteria bacterium]